MEDIQSSTDATIVPSGKGKERAVERHPITKRKLDAALASLDDVLRVQQPTTTGRAGKRKAPRYREPPTFSTTKLMSLLKPARKPLEPPVRSSSSSPDPHSLPDLLARLASLRAAVYPDTKPRGLDAAATARFGWQSAGKRDELTCATCAARWRVDGLDGGRGWSGMEGMELAVQRQAQLVSEHAASCPWRVRQCPAKLYRLPLNSLAALLAELASRVETFVARPDSLATFALKPLPSDVDLAALRSTLDRRRTSGAFGDTLSDAHLALALTGWTLAGSTHLPTLACARCNRTASVGAFTPTTRAFDGLGEHRPFCAFVEEAAWRRQLPRRRTRAEAAGEEFKWAWSGEGTKRRLATKEVREYVRRVLNATR